MVFSMMWQVAAVAVLVPPAGLVAYGTARHWGRIRRRPDAFATAAAVARELSETAVRRTGKLTRPALTRPAARPAGEFGRYLGRTVKPEGGRAVYASHEQVVGLVAPARSGKSAQLGNDVIDAPGPVVVTSTKLDLFQNTWRLRTRRGPVWRFDPENLTGSASTLCWSPIHGCEDPRWALATAAFMVAGACTNTGVRDSEFWDNQNVKVLRALLFAAAVGGKSMRQLTAWVASPKDPTALRILEDRADCPPGWIDELRQIMHTTAEKTQESVFLTLQLLFGFMADPTVAAALTTPPDGEGFDIREFVAGGCGTLYLLGADKPKGGVGPLFAALTGLIFDEAKRASQACEHGRLDPPLSLVLDEVANICPVPLPQWCSDAGGRGIAITYAIQSLDQLTERWGPTGRSIVTDNTTSMLILGGLKNHHDLHEICALLGNRDEHTPRPVHVKNHQHPAQIRTVPVLDAAAIRMLPRFQALLLTGTLPAVQIRIRPVWTRRDVTRARKTHKPARNNPQPPPVAELTARPGPCRGDHAPPAPARDAEQARGGKVIPLRLDRAPRVQDLIDPADLIDDPDLLDALTHPHGTDRDPGGEPDHPWRRRHRRRQNRRHDLPDGEEEPDHD